MSIHLLNDNLLNKIFDYLPIKDKFRLRLISTRFNRLLIKSISKNDTLCLKTIHLCLWSNLKYNESNTLNLTNINQINKLLNKFNKIKKLKLKLNQSDKLDYRQLNSLSTINLIEFQLLTNTDSIYKQIIYLKSIDFIESLTLFCNKYDHLKFLTKQISFLNYFKRLKYFSTNLRFCYMNLDQFNERINLNQHLSNNVSNQLNSINIQLKNQTIINLNYSYFLIDSYDHLNTIKSFTNLKYLTLLSVKEEYLKKLIHLQPNLTHLTIKHLNNQFINLDYFLNNFNDLKYLIYLNLIIHQLRFDLKLRLLLTDFLIKKPNIKLIINYFELNGDLNQFQRYLTILPNRIRSKFNLKQLESDELELNYCSNELLNKFIFNKICSLIINKFINSNQLINVSKNLTNLHHLEIHDYLNNTDQLIIILINSNLIKLKTLKLLKVNLNVNTLLQLTKWQNLIHLEIELKNFMSLNLDDNFIMNHNSNLNKSIYHLNDLFNDDLNNIQIEKQLINNLYSFIKFNKLQKLILKNFKLTTSLLLYLLQNLPNLYLLNCPNCTYVDQFILQNAIKNKFSLSPILDH